jgi:hypothetical protein
MRAVALPYAVLHRPLRRNERSVSARRLEMYTMHEALAREHMRQRETEAQRHRLETAAGQRRYLRTSQRRARQAHRMLRAGARPEQYSASAK